MLKRYRAALVALLCIGVSAASIQPAGAHVPEQRRWKRRHIERRARSQLGTPYRYGGSSSSGFDCSGFTRWTFDDHGAALPHSSSEQFRLGARDTHRRVHKRRNLRPGDLVFHKTTSARVGHVGIYVGDGKFISSTSSGGVRVRSIWDRYYWGPRWVGGVRLGVFRRG